jgi:hypothetical protein
MQRHPLIVVLTFVGLAGFSLLAGWAFFSGSNLSDSWRTLAAVWPYLLVAAVITAAFAGLFMWLAFYSTRNGYDDRIDPDRR